MSSVVGEEAMMAALAGHREALTSPDAVSQEMMALDVSPDEPAAGLSALAKVRDDGTSNFVAPMYQAGLLDGFILGVRAVRAAERLAEEA